MLVTSVVGVMVVFARRLFNTPTREELLHGLDALSKRKETEHHEIMRVIELIHSESKESLKVIRESVLRLESGYFTKFHKNPGD